MNELNILTDAGRLSHPLFSVEGNVVSYQKEHIMEKITNGSLTWENSIMGFGKKIEIDITENNIARQVPGSPGGS